MINPSRRIFTLVSLLLCIDPERAAAQTTVALPGRVIVKMLPDESRPRIYALNRGDGIAAGTLLALNPTNGLLLSEISLGIRPTDMSMSSSNDTLLVINGGSRTLMKIDLSTFSVAATRVISTPNTYDVNNPLYLAAGRSNVVYFTDGGWSPGVYSFDFQNGTNIALFDDDNGAGGLTATRDGKTLFTWRQYGWGAGNVNSWVTRFNSQNANLAQLESSFISWRRDPLDTPILLNSSETVVFNKQQAFVATNVSVLIQSFAENLYAITRDGSVAFGNTRVFVTATGLELATIPFSSTVQTVSGNQLSLFRYRSSPSEVVIYPLADIIGTGWETNQAPVAAFVRTPTNATTLTTNSFNASSSTDDQSTGLLQYRWDWENDGVYDTPFTNQPLAAHRYNIAGTKTVALQVKDQYGVTGVAIQTFNVVHQDDPGQPGGGNPQFEVQFAGADVAFDPIRPYAYVSGYANKMLVMLNLTNGLIEKQFFFDYNPEFIAISPNGQKMYVALLKRAHSPYWFGGHTNYIAEFDLALQVKTKEFEILADPYDLAVTDGGILIVPGGSDQWTDIRTYRTSNGQLLSTAGIRERSRASLHPGQTAVYTADTDLSPSDIRRYNFDPVTGVFGANWDSPYHGDYPMGGKVWGHPNGTNVIVRGGGVFSSSPVQAQDLLYQRTLAGMVEDMVFDPVHKAFFTVESTALRYYNLATYELVLNQTLSNSANYIHARSNHIFVAGISGGRTLFNRLANPAVGAETNQAPVAAFARTPTNATTLTTITFNAGSSTDDQSTGLLQYRWDWENDGGYDTPFTNQPLATHQYNIAGTKTAVLQVKDQYGATSVATQTFNVVHQNDPGQPGGGNPQFEVQFAGTDVAFDPVRPYAYVSGYANKTLVMLNLTNGLIEKQFFFDYNPESIAISPNGQKMYVALLKRAHSPYWFGGHTNYIAEFDLALQVKTKEFEILADPYGLAVTDGGILVVPGGSDQWTDIRTYRTSNGQLLSTAGIRQMSRVSLHPGQAAVYTADTDSSPSDIRRYNFDPVTGVFGGNWDSPYHGDYPMNGNVWCHSAGTNVIVRGGGVFSSSPVQGQDMLYRGALAGGAVEDAAFDPAHNAFFTVGSTWLRYYNLNDSQLVYSHAITSGTRFVHARDRDVYVARTTATSTLFQRIQNPALPDPFITQQPQSQTNAAGSSVAFNVSSRGQAPLQYQWFFLGQPISGQTNEFLILNNVQPNHAGNYFVTVSNSYASVTSAVATLTVLIPPAIVEQPASLLVSAGTTAAFSVQATGTPLLRYQWSFEGVNIAAATNANYSIANVQMGHAGIYRVTVQNSIGLTNSIPAMLRVIAAAPTITTNPASQVLPAGSDAQFSVAFYGSAPIQCRWLFNSELIPGATNSTLIVTNIQNTNSGFYTAVLSNSVGQTTSAAASLTVTPSLPWFVLQPQGRTAAAGTTITMNAAARGSAPITYQWRKGGIVLPGANATTLVLSNSTPEQSGGYDVVAANSGGFATSSIALVTVTGVPPAFVQQPANVSVTNGGNFTLSPSVTGTEPISFQWRFNGSPLPGQVSRLLTYSNVTASLAGAYALVASNAYGQATSLTATVTVLLPPQFIVTLTNRVVDTGSDVLLAVSAQGGSPLTYYWSYNGLPLPPSGETRVLTNSYPAQSGAYRVVASNAFGTASSTMTLTVFDLPGAVLAWGDNIGGQTNVPTDLTPVVKTAGGDFHSLALQQNGQLISWGFNGNGQTNVPVGLSNVVSIASGPYHSLAVRLDGQVAAWGFNASGQATVPANAASAVAAAAGESHSVVARQDGTLVTWGDNSLGQRNVPANPGFVVALAAGRNHTVALRNNGTVFAWGQNSSGQSTVPGGLTGIKAVAAGYLHSLALRTNGTVVAWGDNSYGQVSIPPGLSNVVAIVAGDFHSYALRADGTVVAWGENSFGQGELPPLLHHVRYLSSGSYHGVATIAPMLNFAQAQDGMVFSWAGRYCLEYADALHGPFTLVSTNSPCIIECYQPSGFFRLRRNP